MLGKTLKWGCFELVAFVQVMELNAKGLLNLSKP